MALQPLWALASLNEWSAHRKASTETLNGKCPIILLRGPLGAWGSLTCSKFTTRVKQLKSLPEDYTTFMSSRCVVSTLLFIWTEFCGDSHILVDGIGCWIKKAMKVKNNVIPRTGNKFRTTVVMCTCRMNGRILMYNQANSFETKWKTQAVWNLRIYKGNKFQRMTQSRISQNGSL
jgi:hypothetical protein